MQHERDEQVIFIKDLIFAVLYQWRKVLVVVLAFALLLGGYKAISGLPIATDDPAAPQVEAETDPLQEKVRQQTAYLDDSVLMNLNPYDLYKATLTISITAQCVTPEGSPMPASYVGAVVSSYVSSLSAVYATPEAAQLAQTTPQYLSELVLIEFELHGVADGTVTVVIRHNDSQVADQLMALAEQALPQITQQITEAVSAHTASTHIAASMVVDPELAELQQKEKKLLEDNRRALAEQTPIISTSEQYTSYKELLKSAVIFAVIGAVLGGFLTVCVIWLLHFSSTKVYSARTLKAWTGIKVLSTADTAKCKNPIDRWLRKLEGRADEKQLAVAWATVSNYASDLPLLVCADAGCPEAAMKALTDKLPSAQVCGSLTTDVAALENLPKCGNVLLVVTCGKTLYRDVAQQMQLIRDQGKDLIGCVVLGG